MAGLVVAALAGSLVVVSVAPAPASADAATAAAAAAAGAVLHLPLDETSLGSAQCAFSLPSVQDTTGSGPGVQGDCGGVNPATVVRGVPGKVGNAMALSGAEGRAVFGWVPGGFGGAVSLAGWFTSTAVATGRDSIMLASIDAAVGVHADGTAFARLVLTDAPYVVNLETNRDIVDGSWHHVALIADEEMGLLSVYLDGEWAGSRSFSGTMRRVIELPESVGIGQWPGLSTNQGFTGGVDEVSVYQRAITPAEVGQQITAAGGTIGQGSAATGFRSP